MAGIVTFIVDNDLYKVEKPYSVVSHPGVKKAKSLPLRNFEFGEQHITLTDIRSLPASEQPTLDRHGVCWVRQVTTTLPSNTTKRPDDAKDPNTDFLPYEDEMGGWLKEQMGAETVISLSTNTRSTREAGREEGFARAGYDVHVDSSKDAIWPVASRILTQEEQDAVTSGKYRMRVVHVWRPIGNPVQNFPLAIVDPNSVTKREDAFYKTDIITPWYYSETLHMKYDPEYRWLYMSGQTQDDVIIFSQHDTHPPNNIMPHCAHAAVNLDGVPPNLPPRRSIDMRFVVLSTAPPGQQQSTGIPFDADGPAPETTRRQPWKGIADYRNIAPPRYILPRSKTSLCRLGLVSDQLVPFDVGAAASGVKV